MEIRGIYLYQNKFLIFKVQTHAKNPDFASKNILREEIDKELILITYLNSCIFAIISRLLNYRSCCYIIGWVSAALLLVGRYIKCQVPEFTCFKEWSRNRCFLDQQNNIISDVHKTTSSNFYHLFIRSRIRGYTT